MKAFLRIDPKQGLVLGVPEVSDLLESMDLESKQQLACSLACDEELFSKIVDILANGSCHPSEDDYGWWYPGSAAEARAKFDARLEGVAEMRVNDLKDQLRRKSDQCDLDKKWQEAYRRVATNYCGGDRNQAHSLALEHIYAMEREDA